MTSVLVRRGDADTEEKPRSDGGGGSSKAAESGVCGGFTGKERWRGQCEGRTWGRGWLPSVSSGADRDEWDPASRLGLHGSPWGVGSCSPGGLETRTSHDPWILIRREVCQGLGQTLPEAASCWGAEHPPPSVWRGHRLLPGLCHLGWTAASRADSSGGFSETSGSSHRDLGAVGRVLDFWAPGFPHRRPPCEEGQPAAAPQTRPGARPCCVPRTSWFRHPEAQVLRAGRCRLDLQPRACGSLSQEGQQVGVLACPLPAQLATGTSRRLWEQLGPVPLSSTL